MKFEDKAQFYQRLSQAAIKVGRKIGREEADVFFNDLQEYPINVILKAIDKALHDRDPEDRYITTALLTIPEIRGAVRKVLTAPGIKKSGCDKCSGSTWILEKVKGMQPIAHRCECWLAVMAAKKTSQGK